MIEHTINYVREILLDPGSDDSKALDVIADLVGLPHPADIPRPGQVVAWTFEQWKDWASPYGFVETDRSKHCYLLVHTKLPVLRISKSSTPGDIRGGLNMGAEVRRLIIGELRFLRAMAGCVLTTYPETQLVSLVNSLVSAVDRKSWAPHIQQRRSGQVDAKADQLGKQLSSFLTTLGKFDITPKLALARAGVESEDIERMLVVLKSGLTPKLANLEDIVDCLKDQIDNEREAEVQEDAAKVKARDDAEAAKPPVEEIDKCEITYNAELTRARGRIVAAVRGFHERISQLSTNAKGLAEALESGLFPGFPAERFKELKAENKALLAKLNAALANDDVVETANKTLQERVTELESMVAVLQHEKAETEKLFNEAAVGPEWKAACIKLVAKLEPMVASNDFLAVAQGVAAARVVLADAKKAIDAGVTPTVV